MRSVVLHRVMTIVAAVLALGVAGCRGNPSTRCNDGHGCEPGRACYRGVCIPTSEFDAGAPACPFGLTSCEGACVNLAIDMDHCGRCEVACRGHDHCGLGVCTR